MTEQTYTLAPNTGTDEGTRGLSLDAAVDMALTWDQHDYEIRQEQDGSYTLYMSEHQQRLGSTGVTVTADSEAEARQKIFETVYDNFSEWYPNLWLVTDEEYDRLNADID